MDRNSIVDNKILTFDNRHYMSNSKWKKLFLALFKNIHMIKQCEVRDFLNPNFIYITTNLQNIVYEKYIHDECIYNVLLGNDLDSYEFLYYREIEYLEFLKSWNDKQIGRLIKPNVIEQDTNKIKETLSKIGQFAWEETEEYLRIIGYN